MIDVPRLTRLVAVPLQILIALAATACSEARPSPPPASQNDAGVGADTGGDAGSGAAEEDGGASPGSLRDGGSGDDAGGASLVVAPRADTYVRSGAWSEQSFGGSLALQVDADDGATVLRALLQFERPGRIVERAVLRLFAVEESTSGGALFLLDEARWREDLANWANQPAMRGPAVASVPRPTLGRWLEMDVTEAVAGRTEIAFAVVGSSTDGWSFASKEDAFHAPQLALWLAGPDSVAPVLSEVATDSISDRQARFAWTTDELADARVSCGPSQSQPPLTVSEAWPNREHALTLEGLSASTGYLCLAQSRDAAGNTASSPPIAFTTAAPDTSPPALSAGLIEPVTATTARITWTTDELADARVSYGPAGAEPSAEASSAGWRANHSLRLTGLSPATAYEVRITSADRNGNRAALPPMQFTTLAAPAPWSFVVYGDTRTNDAAHRSVLQAIRTHSPSARFVINVGDVVADGTDRELWRLWQAACDQALGGTRQTATPPFYMAAAGNHDAVTSSSGLALWNEFLPGQARYGHDGRYFSFDHENARIVVLDTNTADLAPQTALLQEALQDSPTWLFAVWHEPIFDFGPKDYADALHDNWGVPIHRHGGDLIFAGHSHYYVRSHKLALDGMMNPALDPETGTAQIVTGNSGAPLVSVDERHDGNAYLVAYSYDASGPTFYGYTELTITGDALELRHVRADGTVADRASYVANPKR